MKNLGHDRKAGDAALQWILNTYAPVTFPSGCILMADDMAVPEGSDAIKRIDDPTGTVIVPSLRQLVSLQGYDETRFELRKHETGKPYGIIDGNMVGVSISHCRSLLTWALYTAGEVGIDVEPDTRKVHPRLHDRICHPEERAVLPDDLCCIRMWTIKEAALKYLGTGLRLAMNSIRLEMTGEHNFLAHMGKGTVVVISFRFHDHWIALATEA
ncbi:MAG: 4'-phosphopantetheinyl transferase family protein [Bacteroidota bacterium]